MVRIPGFIIACCLALLLLSLPALAQSSSTEQRVTVKSVVGTAEVRSAGTAKWRQLRPSMPLRIGWDIRTFVESTVELAFESGSVLLINENSVVTLSQLSKDAKGNPANSSIKVSTGQIFSNVKKLVGSNSKFEFETPTAVASIRGTRLGIAVDGSGSSIDVYEGRVAVRRRGSGREVLVGERTRAVVRSGSREVGVVSFDELKRTQPAAAPPVDPFAAPPVLPAGPTAPVPPPPAAPDSAGVRDSAAQSGASVSPDSASVANALAAVAAVNRATTGGIDAASIVFPGGSAGSGAAGALSDGAGAGLGGGLGGALADDALSGGQPSGTPHTVTIISPAANAEVSESRLVITGRTTPEALVAVGSEQTRAGSDGVFSATVELVPGVNAIMIAATHPVSGAISRFGLTVRQLKRPLFLNLLSPPDRTPLSGPVVVVTGKTLPTARVTVNGAVATVDATGSFRHSLTLSGAGPEYAIVVVAESEGQQIAKELTVIYEKKLTLQLNSPSNGMTVNTTRLLVSGIATPGSRVLVSGGFNAGPTGTGADGLFGSTVEIPDEPGEYVVRVDAMLDDRVVSEQRTVRYVRLRRPLALTVQTPSAGFIQQSPLRVSGTATGATQVLVNNVRAIVSPSGQFSADLMLSERDIGPYTIEVTASNDDEEQSRTVAVVVDARSPQINRSAPVLFVKEAALKATRVGELTAQVTDATPDDQLTLTFERNGATEQYSLDPNAQERLKLDEGRNTYRIKVRDRAGNLSTVLSGEIFYLPGPLQIEINTPDRNPMTIDDLPPMPRGINTIETDIEVEIDDGIGTIPQTIRFVRISGMGQDQQLYNNAQYIFRGKVKLKRGRNDFLIVVEDIAGNRQTRPLTITISD